MHNPKPEQLAEMVALLEASGLPTDDLINQDLSMFVVIGTNQIEAMGGLERFGRHALIRSIATSPSYQGRGLAQKIVTTLESRATETGI